MNSSNKNSSGNQTPELQARAEALLTQNRRREAIAVYEHLLALQPDHSDAWYNLGYALRQEGVWTRALHAYAQALTCGVSDAEQVYLNRAAIYSDHLRDAAAASASCARRWPSPELQFGVVEPRKSA